MRSCPRRPTRRTHPRTTSISTCAAPSRRGCPADWWGSAATASSIRCSVRGGRVSYRSRRLRTDAVVHDLVAFGGSMLAFGDDSPAYELSIGARHAASCRSRGPRPHARRVPEARPGDRRAAPHRSRHGRPPGARRGLRRCAHPAQPTHPRHPEPHRGSRAHPRPRRLRRATASSASRRATARRAPRGSRPVSPRRHPVHAHDAGDTVVAARPHPVARAMDAAPRSREHPARGARSDASTLRPLRQRGRRRGAARAVDHRRRNHRPPRSRRLAPRAPQPPAGRARRPRVRRRRDASGRRRRRLARRVRPRHLGRGDRAPCDRCRRHRRTGHRHCSPSLGPSLAGSAARGSPRPSNDHHSNHHQRRRTDHEDHASHRIIDRADIGDRQHGRRAGRRSTSPDGSPSGGSSAVRSPPASWERSC